MQKVAGSIPVTRSNFLSPQGILPKKRLVEALWKRDPRLFVVEHVFSTTSGGRRGDSASFD